MLYYALYVPAGQPPFPRGIVNEPEIRRYVEGWGQEDDKGVLALVEGKPAGAVWLRLLTGKEQGYGYVDDRTPELSIAIFPDYRGLGIGTKLIARLLEIVGTQYPQISLSVSADNPAVRLYERVGFEKVEGTGDSLKMVKVISDE
ncbi:MAG: GNAT family N-acetyltransferase [Anaerolineales bacterium]|nr:GNAT family N-acetyltransferase [Anaerolineales bacterium]